MRMKLFYWKTDNFNIFNLECFDKKNYKINKK